ncbi:MAG TPA: nucleoside triphosphate pyrophosphatase [Chloroflexota bacterium]|nr:nucleoside triphosphate pyrophosphatase [Chloroflexota bacterium]
MLILASGSPRRQILVRALGVPAEIVPSDAPERRARGGEDPTQYALDVARAKAQAVARVRPGDTILAADTVVAVGGEILGKPADTEDALRMLRLLRGRVHQVTTAVVVRCGETVWDGAVTSDVRMRPFSDEEARDYIATGEPMDKAGAYAVQGFGGTFVESVDGCYHAVVGLPLCLAASLLHRCGIPATLPADTSCASCAPT